MACDVLMWWKFNNNVDIIGPNYHEIIIDSCLIICSRVGNNHPKVLCFFYSVVEDYLQNCIPIHSRICWFQYFVQYGFSFQLFVDVFILLLFIILNKVCIGLLISLFLSNNSEMLIRQICSRSSN